MKAVLKIHSVVLFQGHYVNLLLNHVSHFKSEESFIAYLHRSVIFNVHVDREGM